MAKEDKSLGYTGLGDISKILHNQGVADLSWLSVDEEEYRKFEALPKQNLDIIPELQKALRSEGDERVPSLIPLRPHTLVNTNPLERTSYGNPAAAYGLVATRLARYVMAGMDRKTMETRLRQEFSEADLRAAGHEASAVLAEDGLLGNVYIDAKYLPRCAQPDSVDRKFATTTTKRALFVLAAPKCTGCVCNKAGVCSSLGKRIVSDVPYGQKLANALNTRLASESRAVDTATPAESKDEWKERIRSSFKVSAAVIRESAPRTIQRLPVEKSKAPVTAAQVQDFLTRRSMNKGIDKMPSSQYLKMSRRMMKGYNDAMALAASTDTELQGLAREYGVLGHSYLDMDALGGCKKTLEHIQACGDSCAPDFIIRRSAGCPHCKGASDGGCAQLCKVAVIITNKPHGYSQYTKGALRRAVSQGRISADQGTLAFRRIIENWPDYQSRLHQIIAAINLAKPTVDPQESAREYSGHVVKAHYVAPGRSLNSKLMDPEEMRKSISHLMNTGLHGKHLQASILQRYSREDLSQHPEVGTHLAADDGIQGSYFVDPTAYNDYGKGCNVGSTQFRKRGALNVLASGACTGCTLQTAPGWCSKYAKSLIRQVPGEVRAASQKRVLPVIQMAPVENPVEKYELAQELIVEPRSPRPKPFEITLSSPKLND